MSKLGILKRWLLWSRFFFTFVEFLSVLYLIFSVILFLGFATLRLLEYASIYEPKLQLFKNYLVSQQGLGSSSLVLEALDLGSVLFLVAGLLGLYGLRIYEQDRFKGFVALLLHLLFSLTLSMILLLLFPSLTMLTYFVLSLGGIVALLKSYTSR